MIGLMERISGKTEEVTGLPSLTRTDLPEPENVFRQWNVMWIIPHPAATCQRVLCRAAIDAQD
jgi:hypothetical protein